MNRLNCLSPSSLIRRRFRTSYTSTYIQSCTLILFCASKALLLLVFGPSVMIESCSLGGREIITACAHLEKERKCHLSGPRKGENGLLCTQKREERKCFIKPRKERKRSPGMPRRRGTWLSDSPKGIKRLLGTPIRLNGSRA